MEWLAAYYQANYCWLRLEVVSFLYKANVAHQNC